MSKPEITIEDFSRLIAEEGLCSDPNSFFEKNGLSEEIMHSIVNSARSGLATLLLSAMADGDDSNLGEMMANICATMMMAGFALGWETCRQYGGEDDSASWEDPA